MNFFCQDGRIWGNCPVTSTLHIFFMIKCNFVMKSIIKYFKNVGGGGHWIWCYFSWFWIFLLQNSGNDWHVLLSLSILFRCPIVRSLPDIQGVGWSLMSILSASHSYHPGDAPNGFPVAWKQWMMRHGERNWTGIASCRQFLSYKI